ncbi:cilia- and flagella-associated protein 65 [Anableps anableps]
MLAEDRGPHCLTCVTSWKSSHTGTDDKETHCPDRKRSQRKSSGQRHCFLGLETRPELLWEDWICGREYTKTLVLRNIRNKLQKLHIRAPESKFFSILNPEIVLLSPGTSFSLLVTFRPVQKCEYNDSIQFQAEEGSFQVCLHAVLPSHNLKVPPSVMLPLCAVQHSTQTSFPLKNVSKVQASFKWDCATPFQLSPEQGLLKPGQECLITVDFQPLEAQVYQQQAYCRFGEDGDKADGCCTVLLQGIAKYPYLQLKNLSNKEKNSHSDPELHFGSVAVGQSLRKEFEIFNPSPVNVCFSLSRLPGGAAMVGSHFSWDVTSDKIAPGGSLQVSVTYSPAVVDIVSVEYLSVSYGGALSKTLIKLTGNCIGPELCLSSSVVDFRCVEERGSAVQTVELLNSSPIQAFFQWDIDNKHSVFSVLPASGTVVPNGLIKVKVLYRPRRPMAHHRRVACLILHKEPLFLDLIGTCHSELQQPVILKPEHLVVYKHQRYHTQNSPDCVLHHHATLLNQQRAPLSTEKEGNSATVILPAPNEKFSKIRKEHMDSLTFPSLPFVSIEPSELLFNHRKTCLLSTSSAVSQCVSITNHTKEKLSLMWTVTQDSCFGVAPSSFELAPLKSTTVRVTYEPKQINALHGGELECFAHYKMPQDDPGTGQQLPYLPWCVTLRVIGHSFHPGKEHFTPCCILNPSKVVFLHMGVISYQTVLLQNNGDQPLTFCLNHRTNNDLPRSIQMLPDCGLIQPGKHQIITIRAFPTEDSHKQGFNLPLQLNAAKFTKELTVVTVLEKPRVSLESGSGLYFHPTAVGSKSQRAHSIRNLSCVPVKFHWSIPKTEQKLIFVEPDAGKLHPNESSVQMWSFCPLAEKTYTFKPTLSFQSNESDKLHLTLEVIGMGSAGSIEAVKEVLDVGETLVGSYRSVEIPIMNNSPCPISFQVSVQRMLKENPPDSADNSVLHLDCETGTVPSHSTVLLRSTIRLCTQDWYIWAISYQILNSSGFGSCPQKLCEVRAKGVFPTLQVIDACSGGSVARLCKQYLWKLFSLDSLNEHLLSTPSPAELTFKTPTKHSLHNSPSIFTKVMLDFNFGAAPLNSDSSDFMLMFWNPGSVPVDWAFLFPEDQHMELEDWAVTGEFSNTDLQQMKIQDNQLFRVSPRSGTLLPDQKRAVHFSYSHDFIATDWLPVVFKLSFGREILLNFQGVTLDKNEAYLHFASYHHAFTSVAIRDSNPPRQMYELYNGGAVAVYYEVDQAVLSQLQLENYDHPVLSCLSPQGEVLPGNKATLEWTFSPLEAKMYHMAVPIHILDRDSVMINFEGFGMDASSTSTCCPSEYSDAKAPKRCAQKGPFTGQEAFLSEDSVVIGDIPVCTKSSRILFLTSLSHTDTIYYLWKIPTQNNQQVVQLHPERGSLGPGECAICVLTFVSDYPSVYQLDLICQVTHKAALVRCHRALQRWEAEKKRQQVEFTITDKSSSDSQRVLVDEIPPVRPGRKGVPLRKYKTLPPIGSSDTVTNLYSKQKRAERQLQQETAKESRRPQPPRPALLHLSVTAHSHDLLYFLKHFPDQYNKHYRYFQLTKTQETVPTSSSKPLPAKLFSSTRVAVRDILVDILTPLFKDLLDDAPFVESLIALVSKSPTYQPHTSTSPSSILPSSPRPAPSIGTADGKERAPFNVIEAVLLKTFQNIMTEAVGGQLVITAHPRTIMLPPFSVRSGQALAEEDQ